MKAKVTIKKKDDPKPKENRFPDAPSQVIADLNSKHGTGKWGAAFRKTGEAPGGYPSPAAKAEFERAKNAGEVTKYLDEVDSKLEISKKKRASDKQLPVGK